MNKSTVTTAKPKSSRLLALDILRGITIAGMLLVNNPGSWGNIYAPLEHAPWHGLTPTDLVFPFFMFIMGISTYISLRKFEFKWSASLGWKILRRTIVIFAIGIGMAWCTQIFRILYLFEGSESNYIDLVKGFGLDPGADVSRLDLILNFDYLRILGVMPRLALCYFAASLIAILLRKYHRYMPVVVTVLLIVYGVILLRGNGLEISENNVVAQVDRAVLGENHMYYDTAIKLKLDPEGLLSTIPSIAHVLIGFWCGMLIMSTKDNQSRINKLFIAGVIMTFVGFLLDYGMPINKKIWSPTYAITTCGLAASFLGLLIWIIDIKGKKGWCRFFEAYGVNPLFMYVLGGVLGSVLTFICVGTGENLIGFKAWFYGSILRDSLCSGDPTLSSLIYALLYVVFIWGFGYILYKKKIYIKI